ncbi:hypothetical protein [Amnibacterium kyonggiense]|uniref:Uncharacterized protein n=1 Tax=Amnibacterium kyonggiense TaxID=595671 RepID=A0A4R7FL43_9MICO|nr:hypothetical protein [Amnibacterium kyonggiense]TDS77095.1 hypothetical protein CLV52_2035 [Amnibacterium kyonggiense]
MLRRVLAVSAALAAALTGATGTAAWADAPTASTVATGHDVSYPQCGRDLPAVDDIAVVGVNAGTGTTTNPCLAEQLAWGDRFTDDGTLLRADVYVNTANPGHLGDWWPTADITRAGAPVTNPAGSCAGAEDAACAYVYGYSIGADDVAQRGVGDAAHRFWWLDVETMNSWSWDRKANLAAIEGMAAAIHAAGADVGIYSTPRQWDLIVGDATPSVVLAGAPSWIAGATTRAGALANCAAAPLTPGGRVRMVQWVEHGIDHDIACGVGVRGTRPVLRGSAEVGSPLTVGIGTWGPYGLAFDYVWTRDGVPIPDATDPAYTPTVDDVGTHIAVQVTGSRIGAPPLTLTSDAIAVSDPAEEQIAVNVARALRFAR